MFKLKGRSYARIVDEFRRNYPDVPVSDNSTITRLIARFKECGSALLDNDERDCWFQQDSATCLTSNETMQFLREFLVTLSFLKDYGPHIAPIQRLQISSRGLFNDAVPATRLFSADEIGDSEVRPRIRHGLPGIQLTVGKNLGKNPTSMQNHHHLSRNQIEIAVRLRQRRELKFDRTELMSTTQKSLHQSRRAPFATAGHLEQDLQIGTGQIKQYKQTLERRFDLYRQSRHLALTPAHRRERSAWARQRIEEGAVWENVLFIEEFSQ
ncbi:hypothetical protein ANN_14201 [Periplaneta americana]|uniref:DUF4817 domain-containing protein n=1 Tax=Periplaneta americana TaxID=6978 RepID=A0ABQ8SX54_PERAM|nr:hypothetical protein ANN_14201 [Periplaneta americana]